jgi:uncharacterized protein YdaU (DUF1376 family)
MEDLIYRRLLDAYYLRESPLPADVMVTAKLIRLRSIADDVEAVLREFFKLTEDGWRHLRCDREIEKMQDKQAKARDAAQQSVKSRKAKAERTLPETPTPVEPPLPEVPTDVQLPTPTPTPTPVFPSVGSPTPAGKVCMAMRKAGLSGVNPGHPDLLALLEAGATEEEIAGAAQAAVDRGKASFAYCLAMLKRQRQEAAAMAASLHRGALPRNLTAAEQRVLQAVPSLAAPHLRPVITTPLEAIAPLALG